MTSRPTRLVSLMGFQPPAVAVAAATWSRQFGRPDELVVLATSQTLEGAERLRRWAGSAGLNCSVHEVSRLLSATGSVPSAPLLLRELVSRNPKDTWVLLGDAGLNYLLPATAVEMPLASPVVHARTDRLHVCRPGRSGEQWSTHPLADLGADALLQLTGYTPEAIPDTPTPLLDLALAKLRRPLPTGVRRNVRLVPTGTPGAPPLPAFALAFERGGRLYALVELHGSDHLHGTRTVLALPTHLRDWVRLSLLSNDRFMLAHADASGKVAAIDTGERGWSGLRDWIWGDVAAPGAETLQPVPAGDLPVVKVGASRVGADSCPGLVVALSRDPSATLVSLASHRPDTAWVAYDALTPTMVERARRLAAAAARLQVGRLEFVATDHLGRMLGSALDAAVADPGEVRVDITPGTKAQGLALARWAARHGASIWSQILSSGQAAPLTADPEMGVDLQPPDLLCYAEVCGGPLACDGEAAASLADDERAFLLGYGRQVLQFMRETPRRDWAIHRPRAFQCETGEVRVLREDTRTCIVEVRDDFGSCSGDLRSGGSWFERVALAAFAQLGPIDARTGVKWAWPADAPRLRGLPKGGPRAEGDVLVQLPREFRFATLLVECKAGVRPTVAQASRDVQAWALHQLGRFALPVLAKPYINPKALEESARSDTGALLLDLGVLLDAEALRSALRSALGSRSRASED